MDSKNDDKELSRYEMIASFLTDDALNDVTLKGIDGVEVRANKFLLSARSSVFRGMLLGKFKESTSDTVELGFHGAILQAVVEYILTDSAEMLTTTNKGKSIADSQQIQSLVSLAEAASYFNLPGLGKSVPGAFKKVINAQPSLSFIALQSCKMAGPAVSTSLVEVAFDGVRATPAEHISTKAVACLSADVLEEILKDKEMIMTEYQLFQMLARWVESTGKKRKNIAVSMGLSKHICLGKIEPEFLSTIVAPSGLVPEKQLLAAYKKQALVASQQKWPKLFSTTRKKTWLAIPDDNELPNKIKVEGAGFRAVNGIYRRHRSLNGICRYIMKGGYNGEQCYFQVFQCSCSDDTDHWYISIVPPHERPGTDQDIDFYTSPVLDNCIERPPNGNWRTQGAGRDEPPTIFYQSN